MSRLERWSRLKRNVPQEQDAPPASPPVEEPVDELAAEHSAAEALPTPEQAAEHVSEQAAEQAPEPGSLDHTLPDPETLTAGSDFSAFMLPGVSGALRRRALKRLWATGNYNVRDGLDDYDADYHKLLKPMASELAGKLRRWTHDVEARDVETQDVEKVTETEKVEDVEAIEKTEAGKAEASEAAEKTAVPELENEHQSASQNGSLDDQSDYVSNTATKTC
nr:DUF3306 domain-containing protein [uncultured Halomonas sp.]